MKTAKKRQLIIEIRNKTAKYHSVLYQDNYYKCPEHPVTP